MNLKIKSKSGFVNDSFNNLMFNNYYRDNSLDS